MKTIFKSLFALAAAAAALASCSKESTPAETSDTQTVSFVLDTDNTKTSFGDLASGKYPTLWNEGDSVEVCVNYINHKSAQVTPSADGKKATYTTSVKVPESGPYSVFAVSPFSAYIGASSLNSTFNINFASDQTPTATSVDPDAQIIAGKKDCGETFPSSISMTMSHLAAYALISFTNLDLGAAEIQSISITSDADIAGRHNWKPEDNTFTVNSGKKTITVNTDSSSDIWVAFAPVFVTSLEFVINTDKGTFTKTVSSLSKTFTSGHIAKFNVDMTGVVVKEPVKYSLVTSTSGLATGKTYIIAASAAAKAISTTQNGNNRASAAITKSGNYITDPGKDVETFILESGYNDKGYAFNAQGTTGYLYAAGESKNYLKTIDTLSLAASWDISFSDGVASIKSKDDTKNGVMQYNNSNTIFSCYASASQGSLALYVLDDDSAVFGVNPTALSANASETSASFSVTGNVDWTVSCPAGVTATPSSGSGAATVVLAFEANTGSTAKEYAITVSTTNTKVATKSYTVNLTQAAAGTSTTIAAILSECATLASGSASSKTYDLTGVTVMAVAKQYVVLGDATGTIIYYKSNSGLSAGSIVNVSDATIQNYSNLLEISSATVATQSGTVTPDHGTAAEFTASGISSYTSSTPYSSKYAHVTGTLSSYLVTVDGTDVTVNLYSNEDISAHSGKTVDVYGYSAGYNSSSKKIIFVVTSITSTGKTAGAITAATERTLSSGDEWTIGATSNSGATISYASDNSSVATVDASGKVKAVAVGTATITMTCPATEDYTEATATCVVTVSDQLVVSKTIAEISGTTENGTQVSSMTLNDYIKATTNDDGNNGKVYGNGTQWRLYEKDNGVLTITATGGYELSSVKLTFVVSDNGKISDGDTVMKSGTAYAASGTSVSYQVGSTKGSAGKVSITAIEVTYSK